MTLWKTPLTKCLPLDMLMNQTLMIKIKKIKEGTKSRSKKIQLRAKKCIKSQPEKKEDVQKSPKPLVKSAQLSITKYKKEHKSLKKKQHVQKSAAVPVECPKSVQSVPKPAEGDTKHKKIFQSRMSPSGQRQYKIWGLEDSSIDRFDPYSVTLYILRDKRIDITPIHWHSPLMEGKLRSFMGKIPKMPNTMKSLMHGEKTEICKIGPLN
ncbi:hypothetical protein Cgig2_015233 [Carnegiea gigantea]|uniref:Uncharacterized protein n=1 Tax=Carnegiea gigantea TaxID=171969 RepID=A0A9Q1KLK7_9CARY|nr:hypothetical protein Cgig2_015233 [Carnegiea gigantea]